MCMYIHRYTHTYLCWGGGASHLAQKPGLSSDLQMFNATTSKSQNFPIPSGLWDSGKLPRSCFINRPCNSWERSYLDP